MVLVEDDGIAEQYGGAAGPQLILERPEGQVPLELAVAIMADEAARAEKANDELAVRHGGRHGGRTEGVQLLKLLVGRDALPEHRAGGAIYSEGQERLVTKAGEEN